MKALLSVVVALLVLGCESTTLGPIPPWGTVGGFPLVPADEFFIASTADNGDYNFILIVADQVGYCPALQQNLAGYPGNITYATFTFSNPTGTGAYNPLPGSYPVTLTPSPTASTAQALFGNVTNCVVSPVNPSGTSGGVTMQSLSGDFTQMSGTVDTVAFGNSGVLDGFFSAYLCDTSNSVQGPSQCFQ